MICHRQYQNSNLIPGSPRPEYDTDPAVVARQGTSAVLSLSILAYPAPPSHAWHRLVNGEWVLVRNAPNFLLTSSSLQYNLTVMNVTRQLYGSYNLTLANGIGAPLKFTFSLQNKGTYAFNSFTIMQCYNS